MPSERAIDAAGCLAVAVTKCSSHLHIVSGVMVAGADAELACCCLGHEACGPVAVHVALQSLRH